MSNDRWIRVGAATGVAAVVLFAVGFAIVPAVPDADAPASEMASYFADDPNAIQVGSAFLAASALALLWFLATLTSVLRAAEGGPRLASTAFGAGLLAIGVFLAGIAIFSVAALRPENMQASPELAQALYDFNAMGYAVSALVFGGFFVAVAVVTLRFGGLPAWLGWLALVAALATVLRLGSLFTTDGPFAFDGVLGFWAGLVAFAAWTLAASIVLVEALGRPGGLGITDRVRGAVSGAAAGATGRRND
jgi:Domain of unknown function (DUF4386)